ncbi:MAG: sensor histidine kinase [Flavobacteriales bacterium]|nr:sensor histidine kinase [Flavobacteriales bacterium]
MKRLVIVLLLISWWGSSSLIAGTVFEYSNSDEKLEIRGTLEYIEDAANVLSVKDVTSSSNFKKSEQEVPNFAISRSSFWVKIQLKNTTEFENLLLELAYPITDEATLYDITDGENYFLIGKTGDMQQFSERRYKHPNYLFDIVIPKGETHTYLLKVKSGEQLLVPLAIGTPQTIFESFLNKDFIWGIYFGIIAVMFLYNLFIYFTVKDRVYLYYVIYIILVGLAQGSLSGYTFKYLWPNSPWLANQSAILFPALVGIVLTEFLRIFMQTRNHAPRLHKGFYITHFLFVICISVGLLGYHNIGQVLIQVSAMLFSLYALFVAAHISRKGYRPAMFFLVAWSVFLLGICIFIVKDFGILPYNDFTNYTMPLGSAIEVIMLSLALADKINIFKKERLEAIKEKEESQARELAFALENESMAKEQAVVLEEKVKERTAELQTTNEELNETVKREKELQAELVQSQKMVSIGQLAAGVAHEISNPLNFISNGIGVLKRDTDDFKKMMAKYETIDNDNFDKKLQEIEDFKKAINHDELSQEMDDMFNGMNDGTSRVTEIVNTLKNFSRLDEDEYKLADINEGLDSTLTLLKYKFNNEIKVNRNYSKLPKIECFPSQLNQVFMNIINNAIWAIHNRDMPNSEEAIAILTRVDNDKVVCTIKDNGIGIPSAKIPLLFDAFYTTKDVGSGTGLGLFISYGIIEKHQGKIEVSSVEGKGTEFIISIPAKQKNG